MTGAWELVFVLNIENLLISLRTVTGKAAKSFKVATGHF
jgi:hypothetical protein